MKQVYMQRALHLARLGLGFVSPNPMVGAVIVNKGKIIGEGYHHRAGEPHAEVLAIHDAGDKTQGADLYVNLEPCSHYGRTPPCTEAIIRAGIKKVVIAMQDPNPRVAGSGIQQLNDHGIEVVCGVLEKEAKELNQVFVRHIQTQKPFIAIKTAATLDGKTATRTGQSKWITGTAARAFSHKLRLTYDAILVGIGTVLADDPSLNCRLEGVTTRDPVRVVLDSKLRIPLDAKVITSSPSAKLIVFTASGNLSKINALEEQGVEVIRTKNEAHIDLDHVCKILYERQICSILVEGGAEVIGSFIEKKMIDKYYSILAAKIIGGKNAVPMTAGVGIETLENGIKMVWESVEFLGEDLLISCSRER